MNDILFGFSQVFMPLNLIFLLAGGVLGLIVGSLPGLSDSVAMAVLIPITFGMDPQVAMCMLVGIYCTSCYGGSIPAIMLKIPGTAPSVLTAIDGYEMTKQGKSGLALGIATVSSVFGGLSSSIVLLFFAPILAVQALKFGPPEYFMLAILGFSSVIGMSGENIKRNGLVLGFGLLIASIGLSPTTGLPRLTFGITRLLDGISLVPMLIGLFGVASILENIESIKAIEIIKENYKKVKIILPDKELRKQLLPIWISGSVIGNFLGIIPGAGMVMAVYMSYDQAIRMRPNVKFGEGAPEGIAAPESANNAVVASSMVPLLSLGIPGNSTSALFLAALTVQGLRPGPTLFSNNPEIAYLIIVAFLVMNIFLLPMGVIFCKFFASSIINIDKRILSSIVLVLCITGSFAINNSIFDIVIMLIFGIIGYLFTKFKLPHSPLILAVILGPMMEVNYIQSMSYAKGSWAIFITRPISLVLVIISFYFFIMPIIKIRKEKKHMNRQ